MASAQYHEPVEALSAHTRDMHRALMSAMEELEAIDWYQQRIDASSDAALREILEHNRNEEIEHATMLIEWLRRRVPEFDAAMRTYLFQSGSIVAAEKAATGKSAGPGAGGTEAAAAGHEGRIAEVAGGRPDGRGLHRGGPAGLGIGKIKREG